MCRSAVTGHTRSQICPSVGRTATGGETTNQQLARVRTTAKGMKKLQPQMVMIGLCAVMALPATGQAQAPVPARAQTQTPPPAQAPPPKPRTRTAPPSTVRVDGSEAMFTTICALLAPGFESNVSADNGTAVRGQVGERLRRQQGRAVEGGRHVYRQP